MSVTIEQINQENLKTDIPEFKSGDTITVNVRIQEGGKTRIQAYKGVVIQRRNSGIAETVTVRKISGQVSVERIFPLHSPIVDSIEVEDVITEDFNQEEVVDVQIDFNENPGYHTSGIKEFHSVSSSDSVQGEDSVLIETPVLISKNKCS